MKERDITFDIMKGIGILLVITGHFFGWNHLYLAKTFSSFHMPMFFIVAGYFSNSFTSWDVAKEKIKHYFSRLIVPFLFAQLLVVGWTLFMCLFGKTSWESVIHSVFCMLWADVYGPTTPWGDLTLGVTWFLCALFVAKTLLLVFVSRLKGWAIPVSFAIAIATIVVHKFFSYSIGCISLGLTALPFVTVGWWLKNRIIPIWIHLAFIVAWILAIKLSRLDMYCFVWNLYPLDVIGALGGTSFLFLLSKGIAKHVKFVGNLFAYLGVISLAILCMHNFELASHLGNRICALVGVELPLWGWFLWRYVLTIGLAIGLVKTPVIKKLFV